MQPIKVACPSSRIKKNWIESFTRLRPETDRLVLKVSTLWMLGHHLIVNQMIQRRDLVERRQRRGTRALKSDKAFLR
ncbi:hypothetical protein VIGAN_03259000 [Vigna angularis var. angularis]|uniref:Uncharacterized protein n=1 Tax=Vigna angularis var. angularis TaxID=157739 RepID=A0A0S3RPM1_PHAAN|nr:hypothetical protein VIGAN_03259000 [Vigna angularis var. angularis]